MSIWPPPDLPLSAIFNPQQFLGNSLKTAKAPTIQSGVDLYAFTVGPNAVGGPTTITFPKAFSTVPVVEVSVQGSNTNKVSRIVATINDSPTTSSFSYYLANFSGVDTASSIRVNWTAIGA